jgi:hypothetical protein
VSELEVEVFIAELERMGMKLTALQLADGKLKIYRWRMRGAREHARNRHEAHPACAAIRRERRALRDVDHTRLRRSARAACRGTGGHPPAAPSRHSTEASKR